MVSIRLGGRNTPWTVAAVLGVVAIALAAVIVFVIAPERSDRRRTAEAVGLTAMQQQAMDAAAKQVINLTTYSRKTFDADYARTVAGATGALATDLTGDKKATLLSQMTKGKFDLAGTVTNVAFEEAGAGKWLVLVSSEDYKVPDKGARQLTTRARFEVTMVHTGGKWLASDLQTVGLI